MKENTIKLTIEEIRYILNVIASRPYGECYKLINKISEQIDDTQADKQS